MSGKIISGIVAIATILSALIALITFLFGDFASIRRDAVGQPASMSPVPSEDASDQPSDSSAAPGDSVGPVTVSTGYGGSIDISWIAISDKTLNSYVVYVYAISPIEYTFSVPFQVGDKTTTRKVYPEIILNRYLSESGQLESVDTEQLWHVCVHGLREAPEGVDIRPYVIDGSESCSDSFMLD